MVKHIVFFRFPNNTDKDKLLKDFKLRIEDLKNKIDVIHHIEAGINFSTRDAAFDIALVSDFKSVEDLDTYRTHPDHVKLLDFLNQYEREVAVVDYTFN